MSDCKDNQNPRIDPSAESTFRLLVQSVRDYAIFMLDPTGHIVTWNEGAQAIKGYTPEEILGSHFSRFYPQEQIDRGWPDYELARATEDGRFEDESWRVRKDGSLFWANVVITALRNEQGQLVGFSKVTRDLTDKRRQSEALRQSEERFRTLVEAVRDYAIFMLDAQGLVTTWNEGARQVVGYEADEILGAHISRFHPPGSVSRRWPEHELRMATLEGRFEHENWRVRKDGSRFWANVVITALRDPDGRLLGFSKIIRDLTERRHHEQELAASEQRFRLLVEGVNDYSIIMLDPSGFVSSWNGGAQTISGYTASEILGRHFSHFYSAEDVAEDRPWQHLAIARRTGRFTEENWRARKDGTLYWAGTVITALRDPDGRLSGFAQVTQDLTDRRQAETLAETAQRMHEFIAMLAHELRNPLAPIRNAVELMRMKGLGDPTLEAMRETIERQSVHLTRIIDDLLDVNRIVHGKFAIAADPIDLRDILARAVETSKPLIDRQRHDLHVNAPAGAVPLRGDSVRLTQAIVNLLNNAVRYTPPGGNIWLKAVERARDIEIRVRDDGSGIEAENLEKIFDLFTQLNATPNMTQGGLGVGLPLVRRVVELHGGVVQARSAGLGQGSEFIVRLPLAPDAEQQPGPQDHAGEPREPPHGLRILVVDDNRDAADSLHILLQTMGHDAYVAYGGEDALAVAARIEPDIVLLDIAMPDLSGYEVARRLSATAERRPILVAVTGWGQKADKARAEAAGFEFHFVKPVDPRELENLLEKAAPRRKSR